MQANITKLIYTVTAFGFKGLLHHIEAEASEAVSFGSSSAETC